MDALDEWNEMPEYDNAREPDPLIEAKFRFKTQDDFDEFHQKIKKHLYDGKKVFDGMQQKFKKNTWYPLKEKGSKYQYIGNSNPSHPIYIISRGRSHRNPTSKILSEYNIPFKIIVEEDEYESYKSIVSEDQILILPQHYKDSYDHFWERSYKTGSGPARNYAWNHAIESGHIRHWIVDDNIEALDIYNRNLKIKCRSGSFFKIMEEFVDRYKNIAIAGPNYAIFCPAHEGRPPFKVNTRVYSCLLIDHALCGDLRWRGRYNEDTDLCLRVLKSGHCTVLFNAFLIEKRATKTVAGGNTDELYANGTYSKSKMITEMHPDVCRMTKRFDRDHHYCNYAGFTNKLIRKNDYNCLLYTSPSPRDRTRSRMPSSA